MSDLDLIEIASEAAADFHSAAARKEGAAMLKLVDTFLRSKKRLLYGGFAINAVLPAKDKFYDFSKELPDYDFLTPDPLTDIAELQDRFQAAGYDSVEPTIGIHEGTYNLFVNFQKVADVTFCDPVLYGSLFEEAEIRQGLYLCPVNYLRMNMYVELSHPAGDVSRWPKVYKRLLLLNGAFPIKNACVSHATAKPAASSAATSLLNSQQKTALYKSTVDMATKRGDVLLGITDLQWIYTHAFRGNPRKTLKSRGFQRALQAAPFRVFLLSENPTATATKLQGIWENLLGTQLSVRQEKGFGELLPAHTDIYWQNIHLGSVFETAGCHGYYKIAMGSGSKEVRIASIDTLLNFYFAFYYAKMDVGNLAIICLCQELVEIAAKARSSLTAAKSWPFPLFAVECVGYQPTFAELKKTHRERVKQDRELKKRQAAFRRTLKAVSARLKSPSRSKKSKTSKTSKPSKTRRGVRSKM